LSAGVGLSEGPEDRPDWCEQNGQPSSASPGMSFISDAAASPDAEVVAFAV
jgi:hypothetical protein